MSQNQNTTKDTVSDKENTEIEDFNQENALKIIELVGISATSWEDAAQNAVEEAAQTVRNIGGLDMINQTAIVKNGKIVQL